MANRISKIFVHPIAETNFSVVDLFPVRILKVVLILSFRDRSRFFAISDMLGYEPNICLPIFREELSR